MCIGRARALLIPSILNGQAAAIHAEAEDKRGARDDQTSSVVANSPLPSLALPRKLS